MTDSGKLVVMKLPTPPDGWFYTGEYHIPAKGEHYFTARTGNPRIMTSRGSNFNKQFIIQKE